MAALTTLMTRFCAGEDSWLARSNNTTSNPGTSEARDSNGKPQRNKNKCRKNGDKPKTRQSMPDSVALSPVSGKSHSKITIRARPVWTAYSTDHAKFMAPQEHQPIILTENAGSSNKPAGQVPKTMKRGCIAMTARSPGRRTQEDRRSFLPRSKR